MLYDPETNKNERILNLEWDVASLKKRCSQLQERYNEIDRDNIRLSTILVNSQNTATPYFDDYYETWHCGNIKCDGIIEDGYIVCPWCATVIDWEAVEHGSD